METLNTTSHLMTSRGVNTSLLSHVPLSYEADAYDDYYNYMYYDYNYTYNYNDSMDYLPLDEFLPTVSAYVIVGLVGLVGNLLVIVAIANYMRSITNLFLASLATADLLLVLVCIPLKVAKSVSFSWRLGPFLCDLFPYIQNVSTICSVLTLTAISVERFVAILMPFMARSILTWRRAKLVILGVWVVSFLLAIPVIFGQIHMEVGVTRPTHWCILEFSHSVYHKVYAIYMLVLILAIPFVVMTFTYTLVCIEVWVLVSKRAAMRSGSDGQFGDTPSSGAVFGVTGKQKARSNSGQTSIPCGLQTTGPSYSHKQAENKEDIKTSKQVIAMLVVIVVLFALCWSPILVNDLLVAFGVLDPLHIGYLKPMRLAFSLMSYANSCINPIVYGFMSKNFRETFKKSFASCARGRLRPAGAEQTRVSYVKTSIASEEREHALVTMATQAKRQRNGETSVEMGHSK